MLDLVGGRVKLLLIWCFALTTTSDIEDIWGILYQFFLATKNNMIFNILLFFSIVGWV
jgi:hypothetical protein